MKTPLLIQPITADLRLAMLAASAEDGGHHAPLATDVFTRNGEVVGAAALCAPTLYFWAHSKKLHRRESLELAERCTEIAKERHGVYLATCSTRSPFFPLMAHLGYRQLGNIDVFDRPPA